MNSETGIAVGTLSILKNFSNFLSLFSSEATNSIVVLRKIAVKMVLIDKIIILIFLTLLEVSIILDFLEPIILNIFSNKIYFGSYLL